MQRALVLALVIAGGTVLAACARQAPSACCAALGYNRDQVEAVIGKPSPPRGTKYTPIASPPPGAAMYTTEHGYILVQYFGMTPQVAQAIRIDFFEGKPADDAFVFAATYLPRDARDTGQRASGVGAQVRLFKSDLIARILPDSKGIIYVACAGPHPQSQCDWMDIRAGDR